MFTITIAKCVAALKINVNLLLSILLVVMLTLLIVIFFIVGYRKNTNVILDGPFVFVDLETGVGKNDTRKTIAPDVQGEISEWLLSRRIWWIDFNTYAPRYMIRTDNFSITYTYDGNLIVLNFKQKHNGQWMQHVCFIDEKMKNILVKIKSAVVQPVSSDPKSPDSAMDSSEKPQDPPLDSSEQNE